MLLPTKVFAVRRITVLGLCILCGLVGEITAQNFKAVHDGVEYAQVEYKLGSDPVKINLLRLDLTKVRLDVHHALDRAIGLETTSSIAKRKGAVAAINAGFFRLDKTEFAGDAASTLLIDGELLSESINDRIALRILNKKKSTEVSIDRTSIRPWFGFGDLHSQIKLAGVNRQTKSGEIVLFGAAFGPKTLVTAKGSNIVLTGCRRAVKKDLLLTECAEAFVLHDASNVEIPRDGYVISLAGESKEKSSLLEILGVYISGRPAKPRYYLKFENERSLVSRADEDVVAGVPQLIKDGRVDITWERERSGRAFVETRHPRTAVAKLKDGKFLMVTVDGRQPGVSVGMNLSELADYLLGLGATDAMNLDGGGSTTMYLDGKVVNTPSDKEGERKVGDAIVVTRRKMNRRRE